MKEKKPAREVFIDELRKVREAIGKEAALDDEITSLQAQLLNKDNLETEALKALDMARCEDLQREAEAAQIRLAELVKKRDSAEPVDMGAARAAWKTYSETARETQAENLKALDRLRAAYCEKFFEVIELQRVAVIDHNAAAGTLDNLEGDAPALDREYILANAKGVSEAAKDKAILTGVKRILNGECVEDIRKDYRDAQNLAALLLDQATFPGLAAVAEAKGREGRAQHNFVYTYGKR